MLPFTFTLDALEGLVALGAVYMGTIYGGAFTAILINTPGTPSSIATTFDGHPMAKQGRGLEAISIATIASVVGGLVGVVVLLLAAPPLAKLAIRFGPAEMFWVAILGLTLIGTLSSGSVLKGPSGRGHRSSDRNDRHLAHRRRKPLHPGLAAAAGGRLAHRGADRPIRHSRTPRHGPTRERRAGAAAGRRAVPVQLRVRRAHGFFPAREPDPILRHRADHRSDPRRGRQHHEPRRLQRGQAGHRSRPRPSAKETRKD